MGSGRFLISWKAKSRKHISLRNSRAESRMKVFEMNRSKVEMEVSSVLSVYRVDGNGAREISLQYWSVRMRTVWGKSEKTTLTTSKKVEKFTVCYIRYCLNDHRWGDFRKFPLTIQFISLKIVKYYCTSCKYLKFEV